MADFSISSVPSFRSPHLTLSLATGTNICYEMIFLNCNIFQHFVQDVNRSKLPSRGQTQAFLEEDKYSDQSFSEVKPATRVQCTLYTVHCTLYTVQFGTTILWALYTELKGLAQSITLSKPFAFISTLAMSGHYEHNTPVQYFVVKHNFDALSLQRFPLY